MLLLLFVIISLNAEIIYALYHHELALFFLCSRQEQFFLINFIPVLQVNWVFMPLSIVHSFDKYFSTNKCVPRSAIQGAWNIVDINSKAPIPHEVYIIIRR